MPVQRCLQEGVDLPSLGMVALAEPRRSVVDVTQLIGRVTRPCPQENKEHGLVCIPVLIDPAHAEEHANEEPEADSLNGADKEFAPLVKILQAMMMEDEILAGQLQGARHALGQHGGSEWTPPWEVPLFGCFGPGMLHRSIDPKWLWSLVLTRIIRLCTDPWEEHLGQLRAYKARKGHASVPRDCPENPRLSVWVKEQREARRDGRLVSVRIDKLDELEFVWDSHAALWEAAFENLRAYLEPFPFGQAPDPPQGKLLSWIKNVRGRNSLSSTQTQLLQAVGFVWSPTEHRWRAHYAELCAYRAQNGHLRVPPRARDTRQLAKFVQSGERALAEHNAGRPCSLQEWQLQLLREVGLTPMNV